MTAAIDHDRTLIDWITVTHDNGPHLAWCLRGPTETLAKGLNTYRTAIRDGHGTILAADGPQPRPYMLVMSGKALQAWRAERSVRELVLHLTSQNVRCTRLDLARDTSGPWTPYRLRDHIEEDRYIASFHKVTYTSGKGTTALTVQCGSRASASMLRCYDKKAEMEASGATCPFERLSRWELELKAELAHKALSRIARLHPQLDALTGVETWPLRTLHTAWLGQRLTLTTKPVDRDGKNQSRAATLPEWETFLAGAADDILSPGIDERSPAAQAYEVGGWLVRSVAPSLALLADIGGEELIRDLTRRGRGRRSAKHGLLAEHAKDTLPALQAAITET